MVVMYALTVSSITSEMRSYCNAQPFPIFQYELFSKLLYPRSLLYSAVSLLPPFASVLSLLSSLKKTMRCFSKSVNHPSENNIIISWPIPNCLYIPTIITRNAEQYMLANAYACIHMSSWPTSRSKKGQERALAPATVAPATVSIYRYMDNQR